MDFKEIKVSALTGSEKQVNAGTPLRERFLRDLVGKFEGMEERDGGWETEFWQILQNVAQERFQQSDLLAGSYWIERSKLQGWLRNIQDDSLISGILRKADERFEEAAK